MSESKEFAGGSGSREDPFLVKTPKDLDNVRKYPEAYFKQIADIDLADWKDNKGWMPIASGPPPFTGVYDGQGNSIKNLQINRSDKQNVGLFGRISEKGIIKKLYLENAIVKGRVNAGCLVGEIFRGDPGMGGRVMKCYASGKIVGEKGVGGLVGDNNGIVRLCKSDIKVKAEKDAGGIAGRNWHAFDRIKGYLDEDTKFMGEDYDGAIYDCLSTGKVTGNKRVGGIAGFNAGSIENCLSLCKIKRGKHFIGGVAGGNFGGEVIDSFYSSKIIGQRLKDEENSLNSEELSNTDHFRKWDLKKIWVLQEGGKYPQLRWLNE